MIRPGVAWHGPHAELFEEAMRVVPAIARHRAAGDRLLVAATYKAFLDTAAEQGMELCDSWAVLASAYSVWLQNLFALYAAECEISLEDTIGAAVSAATDWVNTGG